MGAAFQCRHLRGGAFARRPGGRIRITISNFHYRDDGYRGQRISLCCAADKSGSAPAYRTLTSLQIGLSPWAGS